MIYRRNFITQLFNSHVIHQFDQIEAAWTPLPTAQSPSLPVPFCPPHLHKIIPDTSTLVAIAFVRSIKHGWPSDYDPDTQYITCELT